MSKNTVRNLADAQKTAAKVYSSSLKFLRYKDGLLPTNYPTFSIKLKYVKYGQKFIFPGGLGGDQPVPAALASPNPIFISNPAELAFKLTQLPLAKQFTSR